ncbi:hypothetical protein SMZ78_003932 [Cronobacter dublinensis]|nr:hypothetical protein [Cronobacter dublinensis]
MAVTQEKATGGVRTLSRKDKMVVTALSLLTLSISLCPLHVLRVPKEEKVRLALRKYGCGAPEKNRCISTGYHPATDNDPFITPVLPARTGH